MHQRDENSKFFELYEVGLTEGKYEVSNQIHLDPKVSRIVYFPSVYFSTAFFECGASEPRAMRRKTNGGTHNHAKSLTQFMSTGY